MAVFLKPRGISIARYAKLEPAPGASIAATGNVSQYCANLLVEPALSLTDKDGEPIKDGELKPGQRAYLKLGKLNADKYHILLVVNPTLARHCYIGGAMLVEPYESVDLDYMIKVEKAINLNQLDYAFRIYVMD